MEFITSLFYFILVIGILVVIHEFGHFIAAKLFGMRADIFSVGMGHRLFGYNKITGFSFGPLPKDYDGGEHTDYRLSLFPIGGYVKIAGMIDESMDADFAKSEPQSWEFRSKGFLPKAVVLSAGVILNILMAVIIFAVIVFFNGESKLATTTIGSIDDDSFGKKIGLRAGDKIISVGDIKLDTWDSFRQALVTDDFGADKTINILRNGNRQSVKVSGPEIIDAISSENKFGINPGGTFTYIKNLVASNPAEKAGIIAGDTIMSVNGLAIDSPGRLQEILQRNKGKNVAVAWKRGAKIISDTLTTTSAGMIGVELGVGPIIYRKFGVIESLSYGFNQSYKTVGLIVGTIAQIFEGNTSFKQSFGGPILIAKQAAASAESGISSFFYFIGMLSISLAFINILPFPALDGGHLVFVSIESLFRREVPLKIKMIIQQTGFAILILFMVYILYVDIMR